MQNFKEIDPVLKNIHLLDFNLEKQMIVFCITICSLMKKCQFPRFLDVLGWTKNSMFSYNLMEIHYLHLIGLYAEQMQLSRFGQLINLAPYIRNSLNKQNPYFLIEELEKRRNYKPKGHSSFSSEMIRYALLLRYTSLQSYKLLLDKFPLPSISLLNKLQQSSDKFT